MFFDDMFGMFFLKISFEYFICEDIEKNKGP